jgi:chemotaxis protein CheC
MNTIESLFSERQMGLLEEALNIGAGNAVTALSQILLCDTDMSFPVFKGYLSPLTPDVLMKAGNKSTCVEMCIVGELKGGLVTIIPEKDEHKLTGLIRQAKEEQRGDGVPDTSIVTETANILAGAFLTAIHDFCGLNIFHTVPIYENCTSKHLFDEIQRSASDSSDIVLVITNEFTVSKADIRTYLLLILSPENITRLVRAIENIRVV